MGEDDRSFWEKKYDLKYRDGEKYQVVLELYTLLNLNELYPSLLIIGLFQVARLSSFVGAMAIGDLVKSTLGPKGMDKILWGMGRNDGIVEVTNDGATILRSVGVDNPAAKVLVEMSRVQVSSSIYKG